MFCLVFVTPLDPDSGKAGINMNVIRAKREGLLASFECGVVMSL
jgi:hypothetical protein